MYGLIDENFDTSAVPDTVWATLKARRRGALSAHGVIVADAGDGDKFCLDCRDPRPSKEVPVVVYQPSWPEDEQTWEIEAEDFGSFLLEWIGFQLRSEN